MTEPSPEPAAVPESIGALNLWQDGDVLVLEIDRQHARNALDRETAEAIATATDLLDGLESCSVGVLAGRGGSFCAGMDLKAFLRGERPYVEGRGAGGLVERPPAKPLIAAVEGYALGLGMELVLACDLIVAARPARFGLPEVKRGIVARAGGLIRAPRRLPYQAAMELALTGEPIEATRAAELGFVNRVVEEGEAVAAAVELGARIARNGPLAVAASKQVIRSAVDLTEEEAWQAQAEIVDPVFASEDAREGARAFAEKRSPEWRGR
jgi:enoyl-CoA hydratase